MIGFVSSSSSSEGLFTYVPKIFLSFFGKSLGVQLAGQILCGIPWGVYQIVTTVYAAETLAHQSQRLLDILCQSVLGHRSVCRLGSPRWCASKDR